MPLIHPPKTATTGGGSSALDSINGNVLSDGDLCFVFIDDELSVYRVDIDSGESESDPDIIAPDDNPGDIRWILQSTGAYISESVLSHDDVNDILKILGVDVGIGTETPKTLESGSIYAFSTVLHVLGTNGAAIAISGGTPGKASLFLADTSAAANNKILKLENTTGQAYFRALNDDHSVAKNLIGMDFGTGLVNLGHGGYSAGVMAWADISDGVGGFHIGGKILRIAQSKTPASASATGNTGEICWDSNYLYVCIATNTWKRVALSTW